MQNLLKSLVRSILAAILISKTLHFGTDGIITGAIELPWYRAETTDQAQKYIDQADTGAMYHYGLYGTEVYADHNYQNFVELKNIEIGNTIYIYSKLDGTIKKYQCIEICIYRVAKSGHIFDENGDYMGDKYYPSIILVTCKGKDRLVTIWKEITL